MKPVKFKECNAAYAENQKQYIPLPAYKDNNYKEGFVISCWKANIIERIIFLFTGKIWLCIMTFNNPLQPCRISIKRSDFFNSENLFKVIIKKLRIKNEII